MSVQNLIRTSLIKKAYKMETLSVTLHDIYPLTHPARGYHQPGAHLKIMIFMYSYSKNSFLLYLSTHTYIIFIYFAKRWKCNWDGSIIKIGMIWNHNITWPSPPLPQLVVTTNSPWVPAWYPCSQWVPAWYPCSQRLESCTRHICLWTLHGTTPMGEPLTQRKRSCHPTTRKWTMEVSNYISCLLLIQLFH